MVDVGNKTNKFIIAVPTVDGYNVCENETGDQMIFDSADSVFENLTSVTVRYDAPIIIIKKTEEVIGKFEN